ncbi:hypothetical protein HaLaN_19205 [Haematococcus lacustris]|uniref:Uncharacterized protein n=1 Tax=Haematococcus lacustris TaxID=44745 RepID=A0A699ZGZ5_HAELA|nr:hypothetical protein HaLaN_19205 [Haematococcus lacustris]
MGRFTGSASWHMQRWEQAAPQGTGPQQRAVAQARTTQRAATAAKKAQVCDNGLGTMEHKVTSPQDHVVVRGPPTATATKKAQPPARTNATRQQTASPPTAEAAATSMGQKRGRNGQQVDNSKKV